MKRIIEMIVAVFFSIAALDVVIAVGTSGEPTGDVNERKFGIGVIGVGVKGAFLWKFDKEQNPVDSIWYPAFVYISFSPTLSILGCPVSEAGIGSNWPSQQKHSRWSVYVAAKSSAPSSAHTFNPYVGFSLYYFTSQPTHPPSSPFYYWMFPSLLHFMVGTELFLSSHLSVTSEIRCMPHTLVGLSKTVAIYLGVTGYITW